METLEAITRRYSCRKFNSESISEENLQKILKAGMAAPIGMGAYDTLRITVIEDKNFLNEIGNAVSTMVEKVLGRKMNKNFGEAALVLVSSKIGNVPGIELTNAGCALENMVIAATSLGINSIIHAGASMLFSKNPEMLAKLKLPNGFTPVLAASFGYAQVKEEPKKHSIIVDRL